MTPDTLRRLLGMRGGAEWHGHARQARRAPADKHDERRDQLAESALRTLGELGYARTSLREIANNSEFSHGVVHYYFADKLELIVYCVRYYKARCVTRYDGVVADSTSAEGLLDAFAAKLVETVLDEAPMHCLWYDLRTQSMFEEQPARGGHADRQDPGGDDLAGGQPLRRAGRPAAGDDPRRGVRRAGRAVPAGAARPRGRRRVRPRRPWSTRCTR